MKLDRILVPLDGSALAESALGKWVELAGGDSTTLMLLRAAEAPALPGVDVTEVQGQVVREAEEYLAAAAARLTAQGFTRVETCVWYGPAAASIVAAASLRKADLIVMSSHGRSGLGRFILGSVAESVLRATTTPILLVRAPEAPVEPPRAEKVLGGSGPPSGFEEMTETPRLAFNGALKAVAKEPLGVRAAGRCGHGQGD